MPNIATPVPFVVVSACALLDADNRVLVAQRPQGKSRAGLWEFPGGKVEIGETPESALVRELHEELNISVTKACIAPVTFSSHRYADMQLLLLLFVCRRWEGTIRAMEGNPTRWVRVNALSSLDMPPADAPLVAHLRDWL